MRAHTHIYALGFDDKTNTLYKGNNHSVLAANAFQHTSGPADICNFVRTTIICLLYRPYNSRDSSAGIATGYGLDCRSSILRRDKIFLSTSSRPALEYIQPRIRWALGGSLTEVKRPGNEANHLHLEPRSRRVDYAYTLPYVLPLPYLYPPLTRKHSTSIACIYLCFHDAVSNTNVFLFGWQWLMDWRGQCKKSGFGQILWHYLSVALQPFVGPWPLFSFLIFYTLSRTPWTGDQPVARPLPAHTGQYKHRINAHKHPCLKWD
jgi:hypothetical protein